MVSIREYIEHDASEVGLLIKNTYSEFNLSFLTQENQAPFLAPFELGQPQFDPEGASITGLHRSGVLSDSNYC